MIHSTSKGNKKQKKHSFRLWAILLLIALWQGLAMIIGQELLLASPVSVFLRLFTLAAEPDFWQAIGFTFFRISAGFLAALILGVLLAALCKRFTHLGELFDPLMAVMKSTPVASITIIILIWIPSRNLSLILSVIMVLPIIYTNVKIGIENVSFELLEMAEVFRIPFLRRLRFVYIPEIMPYFRSACKISIGMCWKAGIAAEVIGIPAGSIGEKLYKSKIYLETPSLFAWTLVIILLSVVFEKAFIFALDKITGRFYEAH